ncbi:MULTISPECIES: NACHT domain-containing protein [Burkholderia]|uniref:NACHT domain-containing protein n=1 Tax=Burkholderia TaxID=32008 RepID=UPI000F06FB9B|nr:MULTISPECIES: NACHT domain-containing protein [Burkholderia]VBG08356.1 NACHT domain [Burkholderia pseudomallei]
MTTTGLIKRTAIPLSGYVYQNLVGLGLLCDWLDDPTAYQWVKFEADDPTIAQGLDDIVALRDDGTFDLLQVKFTVNAESSDNLLSWAWLLERKANGRSLLQKWHAAWRSMPRGNIRYAGVVTNRHADREFASHLCVSSRHVDLNRVPQALRTRINEELGGDETTTEFFAIFEFEHSNQGFVALERTLIDRFVPRHTDRHGWLALFREAIDWAVRKNAPPPDGKITLGVLRGTIDQRRPEPLEQSFRIPVDYSPPDRDFAGQFITDIASLKRSTTVLWGAPGQGKSTFISYVCNAFGDRGIPFVRHHYFLDLQDSSDRFTLWRVADSLMAQMEQRHIRFVQGLQSSAECLREWIIQCANGYRLENKPFVVVIDGLDHVWRENDHNKGPLDSLFLQLLPIPDNVILLIGTQKVSREQLPKNFDRYVKSDAWVHLPRMSLASIKNWLIVQHRAQRFELPDHAQSREDDLLTELALAFERMSNGHPLVLSYVMGAAARAHRVLNAHIMEEESPPLAGDVTDYYRMLWSRLSHNAKDALHLAAESGFVWPQLGLETCLGTEQLLSEIGHLFYQTEAGQVPFHGSLYLFIRGEQEHSSRVVALRPKVIDWLATKAPSFHRWGWLWLYKARAGEPDDLLSLPNRAWVIESLARAYPKEQITNILEAAESIAFEAGNYPLAIRHRWLKTRVLNGPQFQIADYDRVQRSAMQLADDDYPVNLLAAEAQIAGVANLHLLGTQYLAAGRIDEAADCQERSRRLINDRITAGAYKQSDLQTAIGRHLDLVAGTRRFDSKRIVDTIRSMTGNSAASTFSRFLRELSRHEDLDVLMSFAAVPMSLAMRREFELACIRLAGYLCVKLQDWPAFARFRKHSISSLWKQLYTCDLCAENTFATYRQELDVERHQPEQQDIADYLHELFFYAVTRSIAAGGALRSVAAPQYQHRPWLTEAAKHLLRIADAVGALLARKEIPSFALHFRLVDDLVAPQGYDAHVEYRHFRSALTATAADLFLVLRLRSSMETIPTNDWLRAKKSRHFFSEYLQDRYLMAGLRIVSSKDLEANIVTSRRTITSSIGLLNERTEKYLELCELATRYGLRAVAEELLRHTLTCIVGYGWRKDSSLRHVLNATESMIAVDPDFSRQIVRRIAPIINRIDRLTEDDAVRESDLAEALLRLMPTAYVAYYRHWIQCGEWYSAGRVFSELLNAHDLDAPVMKFATAAVWATEEVSSLRDRANAGDEQASVIIDENARRFGYQREQLGKEREFTSSKDVDKGADIDVNDFPPGSLSRLLDELNKQGAYMAERAVLRRWFEHWREEKQTVPLLRDIERFLDADNVPSAATELLDMAFLLCLELEGKAKAYRWLLAAQIERDGWGGWFYGRRDAKARLQLFALHYRERWRQFIAETTKPSIRGSRRRELVIPHDMLVDFLIAVEEYSCAKDVVTAMVDVTIEDFSDVRLEMPAWLIDTAP